MRRGSAVHQLPRLVAILLLGCGAVVPIPVDAATFVVDSEADEADASPGDGFCASTSGACTLRAAVDESNGLAGADEIDLPAGHYAGAFEITDSTALVGAGAGSTLVEGNITDPVFLLRAIDTAAELVASHVTIANGSTGISAPQSRCCAVTLDAVTVRDNLGRGIAMSDSIFFGTRSVITHNHGGGIFVGYGGRGDLEDSTVSDNHASDYGGGLFAGSSSWSIARCLISGNTAAIDGGGLYHFFDGGISVSNSTITGNRAERSGGGAYEVSDFASLFLSAATIANNVAGVSAGGVGGLALGFPVHLSGSIIAGNTLTDGTADDCSGDVGLVGANLVQVVPPSCTLWGNVDDALTGIDPQLVPLADNGGPTQTHALLPDSPARDAGDPIPGLTTDQRGVARPQFAAYDLGAYEFACGDSMIDLGEECDDGNPLDGDCCSSTCRLEVGPCDDGNQCTTSDTCVGAVCLGSGLLNCDDDNACTDDTCSPSTGCVYVPNVVPCSDGNACTAPDVCSLSSCTSGAPIGCNDHNACTDDSCDTVFGCLHLVRPSCVPCATSADCQDGTVCNGSEQCVAGACQAGAPPECDDGNPCTDDTCDPSGGCAHGDNDAPCDDGNQCTEGDHCSARVCQQGTPTVCEACEACQPTEGCVAAPLPACHRSTTSLKSSLLLKDKTPNSGDLLIWKWLNGERTLPADFGNPLATDDYTMCIFDESGPTPEVLLRAVAPAGGDCAGRPCWSLKNDKYTYRDRDHTPDGLEQITPRSGADGKAKILVKGKRDNLDMPALPLPLPARVQLQAGDGACWEATYSAPGVSKNDGGQFKGKAD